MRTGNEDINHLCTLVHITSVLGDGHGSAALHNAKMQHLKSLLMGFNLMAQLFIAEKQALYMLASFSTFMLKELCLYNWIVPPVSHDKRIWKGTLKGFGPGCLPPARAGNRHQALQLCQFTSSFIHASNTTNTLYNLAGAHTLPTPFCNNILSFTASKLKLLSPQK